MTPKKTKPKKKASKKKSIKSKKQPRTKETLPAKVADTPVAAHRVTTGDLEAYVMGTGVSGKLSTIQKKLFFETAKALNLNPLKREIYAVPFEVKKWDPVRRERIGTGGYGTGR